MIKILEKFDINTDVDIYNNGLFALLDSICGNCSPLSDNKALFFDIETTGFSAKHTLCYLIGCTFYKDGCWNYAQWFLDILSEEADLIKDFLNFASDYKYLIHFNGEGFDLPYLKERCEILGLEKDFNNFKNNITSIDIFKAAKSVKGLLKLDNYRQKTLEQFLGISRSDIYSGGDLVKVYKDYIKEPDNNKLHVLLLHNHDDITSLPSLMPLLSYCAVPMYDWSNITCKVNAAIDYSGESLTELIISLKLPVAVPVPVSCRKEPFYIKISGNTIKLCIPMHTGELKYYYPNYKDYYYLTDEDKALHKSVAAFVDPNHRRQAKAENCYIKKSGTFLPQMSEIEMPRFKINYTDKYTFFEATDKFMKNDNKLTAYAEHILKFVLPNIYEFVPFY